MSNVGFATLSVIPSLKGAGAALSSGMRGPAAVAGGQAGGIFGTGFGGALGPALIAGGAVVAVGGLLAKVGSDFDAAYDNIAAKTGETGSAFEGLQDSFRGVFGSIPTTMGDASDAVAGFNQRLGITGKPLQRLSAQVIQLSDLTETDLNANIAASSRVFGDWGIGVNRQSGTLDEFLRASQASGAGVGDLMTSVVQFGSPLRNLGFSLEESIALFAGFEKGGVNASTAMSGIRQAVGNFAQDGIAPMEGLASVMGEVEAGTFTMTDAIDVFGKRAAPDMFAALQEGKFDLTDLLDEINNGTGTIQDAAENTYDWQESLDILKNKGLLLLEPVATRVFSALGAGAKFALRLGRVFDRRGLSGALTLLKNKFDELSTPIKLVGAALLALISPWALVAAGVIYAYTHFEGFRKVVDSVARWLVGTAWPALQNFATGLKQAFTNAVTFVTGLWRQFGDELTSVASGWWSLISGTIRNGLNIIKGIWDFWSGVFSGDWGKVWKAVKQVFSGIWNQVTNVIRNGGKIWANLMKIGLNLLGRAVSAGLQIAYAFFRALPGKVLSLLGRLPGLLMNLGRAALRAMRDGISAAWENVREFLSSIPRRVLSAIGDLGRMLYQAGRDLLQGLLDGARSVAGSVADGIKGLIPGASVLFESSALALPAASMPVTVEPIVPSGGIVLNPVESARHPALSRSAVAQPREPQVIRFEFDGPDELVRLMQKAIRVRGGDVQAVIGGAR